SSNWLRLARTIFQIRPSNSSEQTFFLERASTAAYLAYQRAANAGDEADALAVLGRALSERKLWRPALDALRMSLDMREVADVREGRPAEIGRIQHLCAGPQTVGALHRARLRAAAHRPARHSARQRQHTGGRRQRVPDRRLQPDQHRDR